VEPPRREAARGSLAGCHGYRVVASDGPCGAVETPLFPPGCGEPDFLVLRVSGGAPPRFPILPAALVLQIDTGEQTIRVDALCDEIARLPGTLPLER
jgi:hypothetical protein